MRTIDGVALVGTTPEELVRELHKMSHTPCATDAQWMIETAKRSFEQTGMTVRGENGAATFVEDLITAGLLIDERPRRDHEKGEQIDV